MTENPNEVLLTEDGHPIGQLVIADNTHVPEVMPTEREAKENRDELLRTEAQELTGNPDADAAVAELFPGYGDSDKRKRAMTLFIVDGKDVDEVATAVGVPARTVSQWAYAGRWEELVKRELAVRNSQSVLELARLRADKRVEIAKEQLEQAKKLRDKAADAVLRDETSVKSGTEAWAAVAKIEHTITGVSEAGTVVGIDGGAKEAEKKPEQGGKTPLVMIFNGGALPPRPGRND